MESLLDEEIVTTSFATVMLLHDCIIKKSCFVTVVGYLVMDYSAESS